MSLRSWILPLLFALLTSVSFSGVSHAADEPAEGARPAAAKIDSHNVGTHGVSTDPADVKGDLAIFSFIVFALLATGLYVFAWQPLMAGIDRREQGVLQNIADAENARIKAEKLLALHQEKLEKVQVEVREILAEARRDAEHSKNEIMATAQKEADLTRQRAVADIERARDQALEELFSKMTETVANATEHVLGRSVSGADHDRLVKEALAGLAHRQN